MAAVLASPIDKACFASPEAADADAAVALLAAAALLDDFAMSACSLLTWLCSSSIRASKGLRSVQPAVTIAKTKVAAFGFSVTSLSVSNAHRPKCEYGALANRYTTRILRIEREKCASCGLNSVSKKTRTPYVLVTACSKVQGATGNNNAMQFPHGATVYCG